MLSAEIQIAGESLRGCFMTLKHLMTPVLRYAEEPGFPGVRPGSSAYLRTGVLVMKQPLDPISGIVRSVWKFRSGVIFRVAEATLPVVCFGLRRSSVGSGWQRVSCDWFRFIVPQF
jgi:hypothetical protein